MSLAVSPSQLTQVAQDLVASGDYQPGSDGSKCNLFVIDFAIKVFDYQNFNGKLANGIVDYVRTKVDGWSVLYDPPALDVNLLANAFDQAQTLANQGNFVLIGLKKGSAMVSGGHVAVVIPGILTASGTWKRAGLPEKLPIIAQAGGSDVLVFADKHLGYGISPASFNSGQFVIYTR